MSFFNFISQYLKLRIQIAVTFGRGFFYICFKEFQDLLRWSESRCFFAFIGYCKQNSIPSFRKGDRDILLSPRSNNSGSFWNILHLIDEPGIVLNGIIDISVFVIPRGLLIIHISLYILLFKVAFEVFIGCQRFGIAADDGINQEHFQS